MRWVPVRALIATASSAFSVPAVAFHCQVRELLQERSHCPHTTTTMSSQSPMPPNGVKSEETAVEETASGEALVKTESSNATSTVLSNDLLKIMKGIVDYLTEYKDEA